MKVGIERVDHVAVEVSDFDERLQLFTEHLGFTLKRMGRYNADPTRRIAMLGDSSGFKIELIEGADDAGAFKHIALLVDDVASSHAALVAAGFTSQVEPKRLPPAKGDTAVVRDAAGLVVQLVRYDADSPDR
jgi:catechol 2,3-dioxygenase-like lactoylglutathione lyase family enzyme